MRLYQIPQESKIVCELSDGSTYMIFHHVDGMYSLCTTEKGGTTHLGVLQELTKREDGSYELAEEKN